MKWPIQIVIKPVRLDYRLLDAITVCSCFILLGGVFWALIFYTIPQPNLPILSGLVGATVGTTIGMYAGARWGNKKPADETAGTTDAAGGLSISATASTVAPEKP